MKMKFVYSLMFPVLLLLSSCTETVQKPNVLFIALDDMADWAGFMNGHPDAITPNLDNLASRGGAIQTRGPISIMSRMLYPCRDIS